MPLTAFQREILRIIKANRSQRSHVAGATVLNRDGPRFSEDIDIFQPDPEALGQAVRADLDALSAENIQIDLKTDSANHWRIVASKERQSVEIDWTTEENHRFFEVIESDEFGYCLHDADIAVNKFLAAVERKDPKDFVDLLHVHKTYLHLGAIAWATPSKDGYQDQDPRDMINQIPFDLLSDPGEIDALNLALSFDKDVAHHDAEIMKSAALRFIESMPIETLGNMYLNNPGSPVHKPDVDELSRGRYSIVRARFFVDFFTTRAK
jgi:hypothetical protein